MGASCGEWIALLLLAASVALLFLLVEAAARAWDTSSSCIHVRNSSRSLGPACVGALDLSLAGQALHCWRLLCGSGLLLKRAHSVFHSSGHSAKVLGLLAGPYGKDGEGV